MSAEKYETFITEDMEEIGIVIVKSSMAGIRRTGAVLVSVLLLILVLGPSLL